MSGNKAPRKNLLGGTLMCNNNCWWIIILIVLFSCCGNNGLWGNNCGCDNDRCGCC